MVNSVIVTIKNKIGKEIADVELPCNVIIKDIKKQLKHLKGQTIANGDFHLVYNDKILNEDTSLSENGIWDGAIITIETEGKTWHF